MSYTVFPLSWLLFLSVCPVLYAADWPMFHGPEGKNRSPETGLLTVWPEGGPKLIWRAEGIGETISGYSTVSIKDGRLFTTGNRQERSIVYCLDLDGKKLWEYDNGPAWLGSYPGTRSTPTIDGHYVYDFSPHGELVCLTIDGKKVWSRNVMTDFEAENIIWALSESIRIDGDRLYCAPGGKKGSFVALDKRTGETIWATPWLGEKTSYACPTIVERNGRRLIVTTYAKGMFGVDATNGELLFRFRHEQQHDINCTRLLDHDDHLLLTNVDAGAVLLKLSDEEDGKIGLKEVWRNKDLDNLHDSVLLLDGFLYTSSYRYRGGMFMCVDWKSGETRYSNGRDVGKGAFTWAEGLIYFMSEKGDVLLIRPNPEKYDVVSRFNLPDAWDVHTWAHPVVCGKRLYIRNDTVLYCYDIEKK